jgi:hypothetical protein
MEYKNATAITNQLFDANLFDIAGPIRINYSSSSITGDPRFSYKDSELDLNFQGDDINRIETSVGELVTVTLQIVPDAFVRTITLIVPTIRVGAGEQEELDTLAIETTDRSGAFVSGAFVPPPGPAGVLQAYRVHQVSGSAQHVEF